MLFENRRPLVRLSTGAGEYLRNRREDLIRVTALFYFHFEKFERKPSFVFDSDTASFISILVSTCHIICDRHNSLMEGPSNSCRTPAL